MLTKMRCLVLGLMVCFFQSWSQSPVVENPPTGTINGINIVNPQEVILQFHAPGKSYVHLIGDMTEWQVESDYLMNVSEDGHYHWIHLTDLDHDFSYRYQYLVEGNIACADPYSELILDPWHDQWIPDDHYPGMIEYPNGQTDWPVSVFSTYVESYEWNDQSYNRPGSDELVIYELLIRDFADGQTYKDVLERLDYLQNLGINAIELMPVAEFDGNNSWGYSTNFFMAPDKYYGSKKDLQVLVDECHQRGIAIILDIVVNHSFGLNPQVRMYFEDLGDYGQPTNDNPWFNPIATHPFSVGYDYNHESGNTRSFFKDVFSYWIDEFKVDGFRLDLSKGLTQNNSGSDLGSWNAYDQSRINILQDYANHIWYKQPGAYVILEHFANNDEETVLANAGFLLWGADAHDYQETAMGYSGNLNWTSWQNRGWNWPNLIGFMESHDEERLSFLGQTFGNSSGGYNVANETTTLARLEAMNAMFLTVPGPKFIWQGGEYGYDISIEQCGDGSLNSACRTDEKPDLWEYLEEDNRRKLFKVVRAMLDFKELTNADQTFNYSVDLGGTGKRVHLYGSDMDVVYAGNLDVNGFDMVPGFSHTGTWYNYFTGGEYVVNSLSDPIYFNPGDYYLFTDQPLPVPNIDGTSDIFENFGCTDPTAINFNPTADGDDGSCQYNLTLQVNLSDEIISPNGVHIAGSFQGWNPSSTPMNDEGNGVFTYNVIIGANETILYKFLNGNSFNNEETVPSNCGEPDGFGGYNRFHVSSNNNETKTLVCFGGCTDCLQDPVNVTFRVNMSNETIASEGVHLGGSFQNWMPENSPLIDAGNGIWETTFAIYPGQEIEYKFLNGMSWGAEEVVPVECSNEFTNRFHVVGSSDEVVGPFCFGECDDCMVIPIFGCTNSDAFNFNPQASDDDGSCLFEVTFQVDMTNEDPSINGVHIAGSFQAWDPSSSLMTDVGEGVWSFTEYFPVGTLLEYKFVNGNAWGEDESVPSDCGIDTDLNGIFNRFYTTTDQMQILELHCFGECFACGSSGGIEGCTYPNASNYNAEATLDNGSCEYLGCMDVEAVNYNSVANVDDGNCVYPWEYCGIGTFYDNSFNLCEVSSSCTADLNGDLVINAADLLQFLASFGEECSE